MQVIGGGGGKKLLQPENLSKSVAGFGSSGGFNFLSNASAADRLPDRARRIWHGGEGPDRVFHAHKTSERSCEPSDQ